MASTARQQVLANETERRLAEAQAQADEARDKVRAGGRAGAAAVP